MRNYNGSELLARQVDDMTSAVVSIMEVYDYRPIAIWIDYVNSINYLTDQHVSDYSDEYKIRREFERWLRETDNREIKSRKEAEYNRLDFINWQSEFERIVQSFQLKHNLTKFDLLKYYRECKSPIGAIFDIVQETVED